MAKTTIQLKGSAEVRMGHLFQRHQPVLKGHTRPSLSPNVIVLALLLTTSTVFMSLVSTRCEAFEEVSTANELSGVSIQKTQGRVSVLIDAQKMPGAKVTKQKNGSVVITLPKTKLPKAYQEYGLPELKSADTGLSARVKAHGDDLQITLPKAASVPMQVKFRGDSSSISTTPTTTSPRLMLMATPNTASSTPPKSKPKSPTTTKVTTTKPTPPKATPPVSKPVATKPVSASKPKPATTSTTQNSSPKATTAPPVASKSPLALPVATSATSPLAEPSKTPVNATEATPLASPPMASTPPAAQSATLKQPQPELQLDAPPASPPPSNSIPDQAMNWVNSAFSGGDTQQWLFPLLAIFGAGMILIALVLMLLRRVFGRSSGSSPKPVKTKSKKATSKNGAARESETYSDEAFYGLAPGVNLSQVASEQDYSPYGAAPSSNIPVATSSEWGGLDSEPHDQATSTGFEAYLGPEATQDDAAGTSLPLTPNKPQQRVSTTGLAGVDERFARLAQRRGGIR